MSSRDLEDIIVEEKEVRKYSMIETEYANGETEVSVVPTKWVVDNYVLCPKDLKDEHNACKSYAEPDDTWKVIECNVRRTYGSYKLAREMLARAQETDGLETDNQDKGRGKRKKKAKPSCDMLLSDSDEDRNKRLKTSTLPKPPKSSYAKLRDKNIAESRNLLQRLKQLRHAGSEEIPLADEQTSSSHCIRGGTSTETGKHDSRPPSAASTLSSVSACRREERFSVENETLNGLDNEGNYNSTLKSTLRSSTPRSNRQQCARDFLFRSEDESTLENEKRRTHVSLSSQFPPGLLVVFQSLMTKQETPLRHVKNIDHKCDLLLDLTRTAENAKKPNGWPLFPLKDETEFLNWELFLQIQDNYDFAVSYFSVVGGKGRDEGEMATNICKQMFSPLLASTLNWVGTDKKKRTEAYEERSFYTKCVLETIQRRSRRDKNDYSDLSLVAQQI